MLRVGAGALTMLARGILTAWEAGLLAASVSPALPLGEVRRQGNGPDARLHAVRLPLGCPRAPHPPKSDGGGSSLGAASQPFISQASRSSLSAFYWKGS